MKKCYLIVLGIVLAFSASAQETVVWGSEVVDVSSEYSPYEYSAIQALHRPNVLPLGGENPNAWRPKRTDKEEFIMVSFANPIKAKQVAIAESENPGAVKQVYAYDKDYTEYPLFDLTPRNLPIDSRLLNLFFEETAYEIHAIRVVLEGSASPGYNAIDAVGVSASNIPINVLIKLAPGVKSDLEADKLSENVNSNYVEHSPIVSPDGKRMYFSRQYHPGNVGGANDSEDIWVSEWDEEKGEWGIAKNLGPPLNTEGPNFISSISVVDDEEIIILGNRYGKNGRMYTGVSMSKRNGDEFSNPVDVDIQDEYNYSPNADYFLVPGGEAMILSAERDDTFGKRDLYVTFKGRGGKWSVPKNLGNDINTTGEDESPFLAEDGKTLYFSSDGYNGYGGADIYVSIKQDDTWTSWSEPQNMGTSVNQAGDDEYFSIPSTGQHLYFTRGEEGEDTDIYSFKVEDLFATDDTPILASVEHLIPELAPAPVADTTPTDIDTVAAPEPIVVTIAGKVVDSKTNKAVPNAKVTLEVLPAGDNVGTTDADADGAFTFETQGPALYALSAEAAGYISQDENIDLSTITASESVNRDISIVPIVKEEVIVLKNVFFDFDKSDIKEASVPVLERVLGYLTDEQIDAIEVAGHTDSVGPEAYNMELSRRRAQAVVDFLLSKGIKQARLSIKAYGETKPVAGNDTSTNRAKNRRVEFKIQ